MVASDNPGSSVLGNNSLIVCVALLAVLGFVFPSMAWFVVVMFALGYVLVRESNLMTVGYGLAAFAVLSVIMNLLHIPLYWYIFLGIAVAATAYLFYKKKFEINVPSFSVKETLPIALVFLMFLVNAYVYWQGATVYPYLEDDDPWHHAEGVKWVADTGTYSRTLQDVMNYKLYIEPYPPAYDVLLANLYQLGTSISATLKFYNAFLIGLGLIFAYYFFLELTKNKKTALLGTFFLFVIPCFMSHFIWAQTLALILMFVAFHGYEKSIETKERKWLIAAGVALAAVAVTQPSTTLNLALFSIMYVVGRFITHGRDVIKPLVKIGVIGIALSMIYYVPTFLKFGFETTMFGMGFTPDLIEAGSSGDTSGGLVYSLNDFIDAPLATKIDQATGIGPVLFLLFLLGVAFAAWFMYKNKDERKSWIIIALLWLVLAILGTQGNALPIKLFPHRFWAFLAIPVSMCAAYAYVRLEHILGDSKKILVAFLLAFILYTSGIPKMTVQTSDWPPGVSFSSLEELSGYINMKNSLEPNTRVFPVCSNDRTIIGFDMTTESYDLEYSEFKKSVENRSATEVYSFLASRNYKYLTFDSTCVSKFGSEKTQLLVNEHMASGKYDVAFSNEGFMLLKLR